MKISDNCYVIHGLTTISPWMVNAGFVVGENKTLIIDCGYNYLSARTIVGYATAVRPENQLIALNTEPHSDHMGGNCFFRDEGIDIYGHHLIDRDEKEIEDVKQAYSRTITNPVRRANHEENVVFYKTRFENPNIPVSENTIVDLGSKVVDIILTSGHTLMNILVFIPDEKILYCGDIIVTGYIPHLGESTIDGWKQWLVSLDKIEEMAPEIVVPGHGEILRSKEIKPRIDGIRIVIEKAISIGKPPAP